MKNRIGNVLYNADRMIASAFGAPPQETISSQVGRIARGEERVGPAVTWVAKRLTKWLDSTPKIWGVDHTGKAIQHADALDAVDDGKEQ